jgi:hypothetical protein
MKKSFQKGMSLPEVLIGLGLASFVGLIVSQLISSQMTSNKTAEIKSEYDQVVNEISIILSNRDSCQATFLNRNVTVPSEGEVPFIRQIYDPSRPAILKYEPEKKVGMGLLEIERYQFQVVNLPADSVNGTVNLRVFMQFDERKKGGKTVVRNILLNVETVSVADRRLKNCVANASYVSVDTRYLKRIGGTMTGDIIMSEGTEIIFESDKNLKDNVVKIQNVLPALRDIVPVKYFWRKSYSPAYGFIAQDFQSAFPSLIQQGSINNHLSINYVQLTPILLAGIKEVHAENEKINSLYLELKGQHEGIKKIVCRRKQEAKICGGHQ